MENVNYDTITNNFMKTFLVNKFNSTDMNGVTLIGIVFDKYNPYTNYRYFINDTLKNNTLLIYNENFEQFINKKYCDPGEGNARWRENAYDRECKKDKQYYLGIPTMSIREWVNLDTQINQALIGDFRTTYAKKFTSKGNDEIIDFYGELQNIYSNITQNNNLFTINGYDIIDNAIYNIFDTILKNKIKYVIWCIDLTGNLGLSIAGNDAIPAANYISYMIHNLFKNKRYYTGNSNNVVNHGNQIKSIMEYISGGGQINNSISQQQNVEVQQYITKLQQYDNEYKNIYNTMQHDVIILKTKAKSDPTNKTLTNDKNNYIYLIDEHLKNINKYINDITIRINNLNKKSAQYKDLKENLNMLTWHRVNFDELKQLLNKIKINNSIPSKPLFEKNIEPLSQQPLPQPNTSQTYNTISTKINVLYNYGVNLNNVVKNRFTDFLEGITKSLTTKLDAINNNIINSITDANRQLQEYFDEMSNDKHINNIMNYAKQINKELNDFIKIKKNNAHEKKTVHISETKKTLSHTSHPLSNNPNISVLYNNKTMDDYYNDDITDYKIIFSIRHKDLQSNIKNDINYLADMIKSIQIESLFTSSNILIYIFLLNFKDNMLILSQELTNGKIYINDVKNMGYVQVFEKLKTNIPLSNNEFKLLYNLTYNDIEIYQQQNKVKLANDDETVTSLFDNINKIFKDYNSVLSLSDEFIQQIYTIKFTNILRSLVHIIDKFMKNKKNYTDYISFIQKIHNIIDDKIINEINYPKDNIVKIDNKFTKLDNKIMQKIDTLLFMLDNININANTIQEFLQLNMHTLSPNFNNIYQKILDICYIYMSIPCDCYNANDELVNCVDIPQIENGILTRLYKSINKFNTQLIKDMATTDIIYVNKYINNMIVNKYQNINSMHLGENNIGTYLQNVPLHIENNVMYTKQLINTLNNKISNNKHFYHFIPKRLLKHIKNIIINVPNKGNNLKIKLQLLAQLNKIFVRIKYLSQNGKININNESLNNIGQFFKNNEI